MPVEPFTETYVVRGYEVGTDNRLTIQNLCNYMQECAGVHAAHLGVSIERLQAQSLTWVLSRMRIDPDELPQAGEALTIETWPVLIQGLQFRRDFRVRHADGSLAALATSWWVVVNLETRRVGRIPDFIRAVALDNPDTALTDEAGKLPETGPEDTLCRIRARLADMDRNRHVNNVRYMDWIFEGLHGETGHTALLSGSERLRSLEMVFRAESFPGDLVAVRSRKGEDSGDTLNVYHDLVREEDGRELVRARTIWQQPKSMEPLC